MTRSWALEHSRQEYPYLKPREQLGACWSARVYGLTVENWLAMVERAWLRSARLFLHGASTLGSATEHANPVDDIDVSTRASPDLATTDRSAHQLPNRSIVVKNYPRADSKDVPLGVPPNAAWVLRHRVAHEVPARTIVVKYDSCVSHGENIATGAPPTHYTNHCSFRSALRLLPNSYRSKPESRRSPEGQQVKVRIR